MAAEDTSIKTFKLEPERHIGTPTWELFSHVKELVGRQVPEDQFQELVQLLEGTCQFEFLAIRRRIKRNFQTFSLAARGKKVPKRKDTADPSEEELNEGELCFMEDLVDILEASHFRLLSAEDWATAQAEEFTFTMPVEVNWSMMDKALMKRFWEARPQAEREGIADMSDRVLVFHRGITSMKARGKFIGDKIDMLVSFLIVHPFLRLYSKLPQGVRDKAPRMAVDVQEHVQDGGIGEHHGGGPGVYGPTQSSGHGHDHAHAKEVRRVTLKALMPTAKAVFSKLFQTLEIQEPGFKNVVVLYRRVIPDDPQPKSEKTPIKEYDPRLSRRNIHVKRFDDIPMADTEMIFPDKRVYVKPIVLIQLLVTIVLGLVAAVTTFFSMELSMSMVLSILGVAGGRAYQVYYSASIARQQVMDQITEALYEQTMDAQEGVIYFLLDQMADQHIKETAVAYFVLLSSGKSQSHQQLDEACEEYLESTYGDRVDFAIERSLPELLQDGLVTEDNQGMLTAVSLDKAHSLLKDKWSSYQTMAKQQHALESVFHHHETRTTRTSTTSDTTTDISRLKRLSAQVKQERARRSGSTKLPGYTEEGRSPRADRQSPTAARRAGLQETQLADLSAVREGRSNSNAPAAPAPEHEAPQPPTQHAEPQTPAQYTEPPPAYDAPAPRTHYAEPQEATGYGRGSVVEGAPLDHQAAAEHDKKHGKVRSSIMGMLRPSKGHDKDV